MQGINCRICRSVQGTAGSTTSFGSPVIRHTKKDTGMENHQGWFDPDSHPMAEEFRVSSS
jgi:hypothetical protein